MALLFLISILILVLLLPFILKPVEENLELFLLLMGVSAALVSGVMNADLISKAVKEPIMIAAAVFAAGILFYLVKDKFQRSMTIILNNTSLPVMVFAVIFVLGLISSIITAIIAAIILVELITFIPLKKEQKSVIVIIACFSIGLGATLTPVGEPLATIAISKLNKDFLYLWTLLGKYIIPGVFMLACLGACYTSKTTGMIPLDGEIQTQQADAADKGSLKEIFIRALKVYMFVMALVLLGEGFQPLINRYIINLDCRFLYWVNMVSAVLDNATLTAAELSTRMSTVQIKAILMGLLISGGMLVPGNIPNIVCASKLKISSREWAKTGLPLGFIMLITYYCILFKLFN